jgi:hypothetical protein
MLLLNVLRTLIRINFLKSSKSQYPSAEVCIATWKCSSAALETLNNI